MGSLHDEFVPTRSKRRGFLALGSNLGDRHKNLRNAIAALRLSAGIQVVRISSFYDTLPVGNINQGRFLNAVIEIETPLQPEELLDIALQIENELGRVRAERWGPRIIDVDILALEDLVYESERLSIPHPLLHERKFVLQPLAEIAPGFRHPVFGTGITEMLSICTEV